jgi:energy-coupling factor transporter ATP-binding protein EcfA2
MASTYSTKWKKDLDLYIGTFSSFIFEGNIHDLQPIEDGEGYTYESLEETLTRRFGSDYCVVVYDHTRKSGKAIHEEDPEAPELNPDDGDEDDVSNPAEPFNPQRFNSFIFDDGSHTGANNSVNVEFFKRYYREDYLARVSEETSNELQGGMVSDIRRILDSMNDFGRASKEEQFAGIKPFLFIVPNVSRFMTRPGEPNEQESSVLMLLFNAMQNQNTRCKLMLFVDKMNDLPVWFESENTNSAVKKIFLPMPDGDFRETYYHRELSDLMEPIEDQHEFKRKLTKYTSFTENFSLRRLQQLKAFIQAESPKEGNDFMLKLGAIDRTVFKFNIGHSTDPWKRAGLRDAIRNMKDEIERELKGQPEAIDTVVTSLKAAVSGINTTKKNDRRPKAVFFFAGPTGTGKTELSKQIAGQIFQRKDAMIRFDMSEFREEHTDSRLFGAPPGYVGYESGGELTRAIKQNPFSIVLFDEIEKASPRIWDKFLQILGDGRLTDGKGETVSFTESIIIFTSNLGMTSQYDPSDMRTQAMIEKNNKDIAETVAALRAGTTDRKAAVERLYELEKTKANLEGLKYAFFNHALFQEFHDDLHGSAERVFNSFVADQVKNRIKLYFDSIERREVMGRIGDNNLVVFNFFNKDDAITLAEMEIKKFCTGLKEDNDNHLDLEISDAAMDYLRNHASAPSVLEFGGRGIVESIDKMLSAPVSNFIFENEGEGLRARVDVEDGTLVVTRI